jgi:hypothetical protein
LLAVVVKQSKYSMLEDSLSEQMNNKKTTLSIATIVAALALTVVALAIPQQALAGGHHNHNHNHKNSVKVDQQVEQANYNCSGSSTLCYNQANNTANIGR